MIVFRKIVLIKFQLVFFALFLFLGCQKKTNPTPQLASGKAFVIPSDSIVRVFKSKPDPIWVAKKNGYKPSDPKNWDLIHTQLEVSFDWTKQFLYGKANLNLKPHFYAQNEIELDAKGFEIKAVEVSGKTGFISSKYNYDGLKLKIYGLKQISKGEEIQIFIDYISKPNELPASGGVAITSNKGLYFINPLGTDSTLPRQIWTQGETESAACWFPTLDTPNEKCTQEISITIEKNFKTLSNGVLVSSKEEKSGFRTDKWEMKQPHSPYLFMMAIGEYAVVKDKWRNIPVSYWVEPKFEKHAKKIFGNTPKMMEYFSNKLGYPYPWPKYDQVVVRDFVSGAMENTSASTFMEAVQSTQRELIDKNWDDIIAHELFHQWFGDLVTIESWANLPLNESFANYAQYLWDEYKYGKDEADYQAFREKQQYLYEATRKQEPMIRFEYKKPDDMFDSHSYAKGGRILHMLRRLVGDEAFFESLKEYLHQNAFQNTEIHHLRLAFEKVTGKDLNWFFNQWFLLPGHPELVIDSKTEGKKTTLFIKQTQDSKFTPIYKIPGKLEVWTKNGCKTIEFELNKAVDTVEFFTDSIPETIIWDADLNILANVQFNQSLNSLLAQYTYASHGMHRYEALQKLKSEFKDFPNTQNAMKEALSDNFWANRHLALEFIGDEDLATQKPMLEKIKLMASEDKIPQVRTMAYKVLNQHSFENKKECLEKGMSDSSVSVSQIAYKGYIKEGYPDLAKKISQIPSQELSEYKPILAEYYASKKGKESFIWFENALTLPSESDQYEVIQSFGRFLLTADSITLKEGLNLLFTEAMKKKKADFVIGTYQILKNYISDPGIKEKRLEIKNAFKNQEFGEILEYLE